MKCRFLDKIFRRSISLDQDNNPFVLKRFHLLKGGTAIKGPTLRTRKFRLFSRLMTKTIRPR